MSPSSISLIYGTGLPVREPDRSCAACGAQGTIGRAVRFTHEGNIREMYRFCSTCWSDQRAHYRKKWTEESRREYERFAIEHPTRDWSDPPMAFEGASWHNALELLGQVQGRRRPGAPTSRSALAVLALQFKRLAADIDEPMPPEIEELVRTYGFDTTGHNA
jgi:hypothetical protein